VIPIFVWKRLFPTDDIIFKLRDFLGDLRNQMGKVSSTETSAALAIPSLAGQLTLPCFQNSACLLCPDFFLVRFGGQFFDLDILFSLITIAEHLPSR
jgi:hypothetical protein